MPREVLIGMLGSGFIAEFHALGLRYVPGVRVVANFGAGPDRRAAFGERFAEELIVNVFCRLVAHQHAALL